MQQPIMRIKYLPNTIGAKDAHRVRGIWWPRINCDAAALKNGSKAVVTKATQISMIRIVASDMEAFNTLL